MADVSKFVIDRASYDVKDRTARSEIATCVKSITNLENNVNELSDKLPVYAYNNENLTIK